MVDLFDELRSYGRFDSTLLEQKVDDAAAKLEEDVSLAAAQKTAGLDPNYQVLNPDEFRVIDRDTVYHIPTKQSLRFSSGESGVSLDAFETGLDPQGKPNRYYEQNPDRFKAHAEAAALLLRKDSNDISPQDLYDIGRAQKQELQNKWESLRGTGFRIGDYDETGKRKLISFNDDEVNARLKEMNAGYFSGYNWKQAAEDQASGKYEELMPVDRTVGEAVVDSGIAMYKTTRDMVANIPILAGLVAGSEFAMDMYNAKQGQDAFLERFVSKQQKQDQEFRQKYKDFVGDPLFQQRKEKMIKEGMMPHEADLNARALSFADSLESIIENPSEGVDVAIASLPYMVGAGLFSKVVTKRAINSMAKGGTYASLSAAEKAAITGIAEKSAIGFTGVTEGVGNAIGTYDRLINQSPEEWQKSEAYNELIASGVAPADAAHELASSASLYTFITTGVLAAGASWLTGAGSVEAGLFQRMEKLSTVSAASGWKAKGAAALAGFSKFNAPATKEGIEEFIQSGGGEEVSQRVQIAVTGNEDLLDPVTTSEQAALGVVAGVGTGGTIGNTRNIAKATGKAVTETAKAVGQGYNKFKAKTVDAAEDTGGTYKVRDTADKLRESPTSTILGGTSSKAGRDLAAIDRAAGGQSAENAATALDQVIKQAEDPEGALLPAQATLLLKRFEARIGPNPTEEQQARIAEYRAKVGGITSAFKESISNQLADVVKKLTSFKTQDALESEEGLAARNQYIALAKMGEKYGLNAAAISMANTADIKETGYNVEDDMPDPVRQELQQYRTTEALLGELERTVQKANPNQKGMQGVAGDVLTGGGTKKSLRDYIDIMQEAIATGNFNDFKNALGDAKKRQGLSNFIEIKAKQQKVLDNFIAYIESGMDEKDALAKAQKDAGVKPSKTFNFYWDATKNATKNLAAQKQRELDLMVATQLSLLRQWNMTAAPGQTSKAGKAANRYILSQTDGGWNAAGDIDQAAIEALVEAATGDNIESARLAAIEAVKEKAERDKVAAKEKAEKLKKESFERTNYNPITYTLKLIRDRGDRGQAGGLNAIKTAANIFTDYKKKGNGNYILQALEQLKGQSDPFQKAVRAELRKLFAADDLFWPTIGHRKFWLAEQEKAITEQSEGEPKAELKETKAEPESTQSGAVGSTEEQQEPEIEEVIQEDVIEPDGTPTPAEPYVFGHPQVNTVRVFIEARFGKKIFDFLDVVLEDPDVSRRKVRRRSGFYNRDSGKITIIAKNIHRSAQAARVPLKDWVTWVVFHELGHKAVKELYGDAVDKGKRAYEKALVAAFEKSEMIRDMADAVSQRKWKVNYADLQEEADRQGLEDVRSLQFVAIEEAVVEVVAALQSKDMNPEMALKELEKNWHIDGFGEKYAPTLSKQEHLKAALESIKEIFNKLLAAIGLITPNVEESGVEQFFMAIAGKQLELIGDSQEPQAIPTMDNIRTLSALAVEDLIAFYQTLDRQSDLAKIIVDLLQAKGYEQEDEQTEDDPWANSPNLPTEDWTSEVPGPNVEQEDPFYSSIPEGNMGTWTDEDFDPASVGAPVEPQESTSPQTNASVEGQSVPAEQTGKSKASKPKEPYSDARLFGIRMILDVLDSILEAEEDIPAHQVSMPTQKSAQEWSKKVEEAREKNRKVSGKVIAAWMKGVYEAELTARNQEAPVIKGESTAESNQVVEKVAELREKGEIEVHTSSLITSMVDFLSDTMLRFIWKLAVHDDKHPRAGQRWTDKEYAQAMDPENADHAKLMNQLRADVRFQLNLKGVPVSAQAFFKVAKDKTSNLLNSSLNIFSSLQGYAARKSFFQAIKMSDKEQMGMNTIITFVNNFKTKFDEIHLGLLNEVGIDPKTGKEYEAQGRTPLRTGSLVVDKLGEAIWRPMLEYAMQYLYDEEGNLNENFVSIMALEVGAWLTSAGANALNNDESTVNSIYGLPEERELAADPQLYRVLMNAAKQGTLKSQAVQQVGQRILRAMNIKTGGRNMTPLMKQNLETSLGEMAFAVMEQMSLIEARTIPGYFRIAAGDLQMGYGDFLDGFNNDMEEIVLIMPLPLVGIGSVINKKTSTTEQKLGSVQFTADNFRESIANNQLRTAYMAASKVLKELFTNGTYIREPGFEPQEVPTHRARTNSKIPKIQRKAMEIMNRQVWEPMLGAFRLLSIIPPERMIVLNGGYSQEEIDNAMDIRKPEMESKNATILRAITNAQDWVGTNGFNPFYFAYKMISTGRLYIDSNTINTQADKLHRFLFGMKGWEMKISTAMKPTGKLAQATKMFKMSVAVALDLKVNKRGPDALHLDDVVQAVDDFLATPVAVEVMNAILAAQKNNTQVSPEIIDKARAAGLLNENFHSFLALGEYARYKASKGNIVVNLPLEIDGKTNGIAIGAMQTPFSSIRHQATDEGKADVFFNILAATGVFTADKSISTFAEFRDQDGSRDNYEGLADDADEVLEDLMANGWLTDNEAKFLLEKRPELAAKIKAQRKGVAKAAIASRFLEMGRKLAKTPLMVASYNAGIDAIKRALSRQALDEYFKRMSEVSTVRSEDAAADYDRLMTDFLDIVIDMGRLIYAGQERVYESKDRNGDVREYRKRDLQFDPYTEGFDKSRYGNRAKMEELLRKAFPTFEELDAYRRTSESLNPAARRPKEEAPGIIDFRNEIDGFNAVISATFGQGIEAGINNRLGPMKEIRNMMNQMVYIMNLVAKTYYEAAVKRVQDRLPGGRALTDGERQTILNQMQRKGLIPSIRTSEGSDLDEELELHDPITEPMLGPGGKPIRARANFRMKLALRAWRFLPDGFLATPLGQASSVSLLIGPTLGLQIGVRALVKAIHSSDGSVMTRILGRENANLLGVHDAIVGNPLELLDHAIFANEQFLDVQSKWDLGAEMRKSLDRFLQVMTDELLFSSQDRKRVMSQFFDDNFWPGYDEEASLEENFLGYLADVDMMIDTNTEARKALFEVLQGGAINQFAMDGGSHPVGESLQDVIDELKTTDEAAKTLANLEGTRLAAEVQTAITEIAHNLEEGNPLIPLINYLSGKDLEGVAFTDALDVIWGAFNSMMNQSENGKDRSRDRFKELIQVLKATTTIKDEDGNAVPLRVIVEANNRGLGSVYKPSTHTIALRPGDTTETILEDLIRQGMIAATSAKLQELFADKRDRTLVMKRIVQNAVKWANQRGKDEAKARARELVKQLTVNPNDSLRQISLITEYLVNVQGSLEEVGKGLSFEFDGLQVNTSLNDMTRILAQGKDKLVFYSSPRGVNQSRFDGVQGKTVTYELVTMLMEGFSELDNLSEEEQLFLDNAKKLLDKGLETIDELLLKQVDGQAENLNQGEYMDENSTILLETADNTLTSPAAQSRQEVLLHEIYHPLLKLVLSKDMSRLRLIDLYDFVMKEVIEGRLTYKIFLPQTTGIHTQLDEDLARERFEHIFQMKRNPDGSYSKSEQDIRYHEFFAMAMTNFTFAKALRGIPMKVDKYSFWQNNLFDTIVGAITQAFRWLFGAARKENKDVKEALDHLAKDVLGLNRRHQKILAKAQDSGPIQGAMDWIDAKLVEKFAQLNSAKLQAWARKNSLDYLEIQAEYQNEKSPLRKLMTAAKSMTASALDDRLRLEEFRNVLESALLGYNKNGTMYQLLQELLPWAERNHRHIDILRRSNVLIDMTRQKIIETMKGTMRDIFDPFRRLSEPERGALSKVLLRTDLSVLLRSMDAGEIMDLLASKVRVLDRINALLPRIEELVSNDKLWKAMNLQSRSVAHMQIHGTPLKNLAFSEFNVHNIVALQNYLELDQRTKFDPEIEAQLIEMIDELTTLRAILEIEDETLDIANKVIQHEMSRPGVVNGFSGTLGLAKEHKEVSMLKNFDGNPINMWKGYVYETFDEDIDVKFVADTPFNEIALINDGYKKVAVLPPSKLMPEIAVKYKQVAIYVNNRKGVNTYSKSAINTTSEQKHGFGLFELHLTVDEWNNEKPGKSASEVISLVEEMEQYSQMAFLDAVNGRKVDTGPGLVPLYNAKGKVVDFRYVMSEANKVKYLQKREYIDEILPRMFGAIEDRANTPIINHEIVNLLFQEKQQYRNNPDHRFMIVGSKEEPGKRRSTIALKNDLVQALAKKKAASSANDSVQVATQKALIKSLKQRIASQEMWDLLPKETQLYAEQLFGGKYMVVRDEMYNMIFGFRKLAFANNKWLGRTAPIVRMIEKIWQEIIQWERFRIAVLEPSVVIGNMISNTFVLLAHGIPPQYIWRYFNEAVLGMRSYQKSVTERQKLEHQISIARQYGKPTLAMEQRLFRLDMHIERSDVHDIVEEGLFTSIVEEFGGDEQSYRKRLTNKLLDKVGVVAGSQSVVKLSQELYMVPGSQMARFALMGTQYGDFVARYIKLKWDMEVKKMPKDKAIREALDTFIYYNIPQNKYLQWMNDNGLFMFTKFFFRIQHVAFRLFKNSPSRSMAAFGFQAQHEYTVLGDSIGNYMGNVTRMANKFDPLPVDNLADGDTLKPSLFKWMGIFYGDLFGD